jgi:hypothetical protein
LALIGGENRMALNALEIQLVATPDNIEIKARVPLDIINVI